MPVSEDVLLDLLKKPMSTVKFVRETVVKYTARTTEKKIKQFFFPKIELSEKQRKEFRKIIASFYVTEKKQ